MNETLLRIISGFSIAIIYVVFFQFGRFGYLPLYFFISFVNLTVLTEFYGMFLKKANDKFTWYSALFFSLIIVSLIYLDSLKSYQLIAPSEPQFVFSLSDSIPDLNLISSVVFVLFIIVNGLYFILKSRLNDSVQVISFSLFGLLYISVTISFIFKLRGLPYGAFYIWFVSVITVMTDVGGYFIGKFFGRHKINLPVSPKKTWEGYIGSFLFQFISVFIFYFVSSKYFAIPSFSHIQLAIVSILIFSTSVFGDLFESLIKRNASIKDSGQFLPGHGGLLDRIDSIMFSLPVFYFYLTFFR